MTVQIAWNITRTNRKFNKGDQIVARLRRALHNQVKPRVRQQFLVIVANWRHNVQFPARNIDTADVIGFFMHPGGAGAQIYAWVTEGTEGPYPIPKTPKVRGTLAYQVGYTPKTRPGGRFGGPGTHFGSWTHPKQVTHPGIAAREFEESVARDVNPWFQATMQAAWRNAIRTV
jgi:hypothetical protein